jgi:hypothetical protein
MVEGQERSEEGMGERFEGLGVGRKGKIGVQSKCITGSSANNSMLQAWDLIMSPFKGMWDEFVGWLKKVFDGKGKGFWGKVGKVFGKAFSSITKSKVWTTLLNSTAFKWIKAHGAKLLAKATMFTGKLLNVVGWVLLLKDAFDMATVADCLFVAFKYKGDASMMPTYCDGEGTKMIVAWSLERAGIAVQG